MFLKQLALWSGFKEPIQCESSLTFLLLMHSFSCGINHPPAAEGPLQKQSCVRPVCVCLSVKRAREKRERKKSYTWKQSDSRLYPEYRGLQLFLSVDKKKARKHPKVSKLEADASRRSFSVAIVCIHLGKFDRAFFVVSFGVFTVRFTSYRLIFVERLRLISLRSCS